MQNVVTLKAQATNLTKALAAMDIKLSRAQSLEVIAKQYGIDNWDTLSGMLKTPKVDKAPTLADMPFLPTSVTVEQGVRSVECELATYDSEVLALLHDEPALISFLERNRAAYPEGLDTVALYALADGADFEFRLNDLLGMQYKVLGGVGNWMLADGETYLRFNNGNVWTPMPAGSALPSRLAIPESVKTAKGCKLLTLTSHDGDFYDLHAIVPPHLDIEVIKAKVSQELKRLKQQDRDNEGNPEYVEYTGKDVLRFISSLGCEPVKREMCSENWDV